ncbi:MAG: formyltransferase family protein [Patescibacteria group bacterium]
MNQKVNLVLIASGNGTNAEAIIKAYRAGFLPNIEITGLISTKEDAGCIKKANFYGIEYAVIPYARTRAIEFDSSIQKVFEDMGANLAFLVGCIHPIPTAYNVDMYNIHPADIKNHGGKGMYGLQVHIHVLEGIRDLINRGKKKIRDDFFTSITVHEVSRDYDAGYPLLVQSVEIPQDLIKGFIDQDVPLKEAAARLQAYVLPFEWEMLPTAVNIAALRIIQIQNAKLG